MVQPAGHAIALPCEGHIVGFIGGGQPHAHLGAVIELNPLGAAKPEVALVKFAAAAHIDGEAVIVVEPSDIHPARGVALGLVAQRRPQRLRRLVPLRVVIQLHQMAIRVTEAEGAAMAKAARMLSDGHAIGAQRGHPAGQRGRAAGAPASMAKARGGGGGQLQ